MQTANAKTAPPDGAGAQGAAVQRKRTLEPYVIVVPDLLVPDLDEAVELVSKRLGESPDAVRRGVEISALKRGIASLKGEEGKR